MRLPLKPDWSQGCVTREDALSVEMRIKGWSRKMKEASIPGNATSSLSDLKNRSENRAERG
ncbi:MAG: hypothetical protein WAT12_05165, partial [Candidatus Nitrotoga sp.]